MSQDIFDNIDPTSTSGTELATLLNEFKDAVASGFSGDTSRPSNLQAYGYWIKYNDPDDGLLSFYLYDGTQDIELFQINKSTATIILSNSEDEFNIVKNSDDAIGPDLGFKKGRVTGDQTLTSDILGNIKWIGRDGTPVEYTQAKVTSTALEDVTSGAHGANIAFYVTQTGTSSLVKAITISDESKLGIGVDDPTMMVETFDTSANAGYKATIAQDSTSGPSMTLHKKRVTTNGQVLTGDTIGNFKLQSTDNAGAEIPAGNIKAVAAEDHLATQGGTNIIIERVKLGEVALSTAVTIDDDGMTIADDLTVTGTINADGGMVPTGDVTFPQDVTITGDLTVNGTTTTVNTDTLEVEDANITINNNGTDATSEGAGLTVERTGTDGSIIYEDAATSKFKIGAAGSEIEVADISSTQTLTNKTVSGGTVTGASQESPARSDVKKDTEANLITYAATAADGQMCFATDTQKMYQIIDNDLEDVGGGGVGNTETIAILDGEDDIADWDTSGLTNATLVINSTTPLNGDNDYKFGNVTGSTGEIAWSPNQLVPLKSQSSTNLLGVDLAGSYDGDDNDLKLHFYDVTNSVYLESVFVKAGDGLRYELLGYADSTASIKFGIEVIQVNNGKFFFFDDVQFKKVVYPQITVAQNQSYYIRQLANAATDITGEIRFNLSTATIEQHNEGVLFDVEDDSSGARTTWTAKTSGTMTVTGSSAMGAAGNNIRIYKNGVWFSQGSDSVATGYFVTSPSEIPVALGDVISFYSAGWYSSASDVFVSVSMVAENTNTIVTSNEDYDPYLHETAEKFLSADFTTASVDIPNLQFDNLVIGKEYELTGTMKMSNLTGVGTAVYVDFRSAPSGGGTLYGAKDADSTSTIAYNPYGVSIKFTAVSTSLYSYKGSVAGTIFGDSTKRETFLQLRRVDLQPKLLALPQSKQNVFSARVDFTATPTLFGNNADWIDTMVTSPTGYVTITYKTGIFTVAPALSVTAENDSTQGPSIHSSTATGCVVRMRYYHGGTYINTDFSITAVKLAPDYTPPGVYVGKVDPYLTAYIKDVKSATSNGGDTTAGTFTAGTEMTRDLNTVSGDTSIVSLLSNQFTLAPGRYLVRAYIPNYDITNQHQSRIRNITASTTAILGQSGNNASSSNVNTILIGTIDISVSSTFEVQQAFQTAETNGLGLGNYDFGEQNVFTQVEITKLS